MAFPSPLLFLPAHSLAALLLSRPSPPPLTSRHHFPPHLSLNQAPNNLTAISQGPARPPVNPSPRLALQPGRPRPSLSSVFSASTTRPPGLPGHPTNHSQHRNPTPTTHLTPVHSHLVFEIIELTPLIMRRVLRQFPGCFRKPRGLFKRRSGILVISPKRLEMRPPCPGYPRPAPEQTASRPPAVTPFALFGASKRCPFQGRFRRLPPPRNWGLKESAKQKRRRVERERDSRPRASVPFIPSPPTLLRGGDGMKGTEAANGVFKEGLFRAPAVEQLWIRDPRCLRCPTGKSGGPSGGWPFGGTDKTPVVRSTQRSVEQVNGPPGSSDATAPARPREDVPGSMRNPDSGGTGSGPGSSPLADGARCESPGPASHPR